jgi:hypothetical protein
MCVRFGERRCRTYLQTPVLAVLERREARRDLAGEHDRLARPSEPNDVEM